MARHESDREDLLREATALVQRAELQVAGFEEPVVVGFRQGGAASVFFGADPVYQFNSDGELRRAYVGGLLYKAEWGKLVELRRERSVRETALIRRELRPADAAAFVASMKNQLTRLQQALAEARFSVSGQWPLEGNVPRLFQDWLEHHGGEYAIAKAPNVGTSRM